MYLLLLLSLFMYLSFIYYYNNNSVQAVILPGRRKGLKGYACVYVYK